MDKITQAFKEAKRSNLLLFTLVVPLGYTLYYSSIVQSIFGIVVSSLGVIFVVYLITMNSRHNSKLNKLLKMLDDHPNEVLKRLENLIGKIDKSNGKFADNVKGSFVYGIQAQAVRNQFDKDKEKHNKIAKIIRSINIYVKQNNINL